MGHIQLLFSKFCINKVKESAYITNTPGWRVKQLLAWLNSPQGAQRAACPERLGLSEGVGCPWP